MLPGVSEEDRLQFACQRLVFSARKTSWSDEVGELDEAVAVLDQNDHQTVKQEQESMANVVAEEEEYKDAYVSKCKAVRDGHAARKGSQTRKKTPAKIKVPPMPAHDISLEVARSLKPPGASLWQCVQFGNWQGHVPPWPRISRAWSKYGERESLQLVLRYLRECWCEQTGVAWADCPGKHTFVRGTAIRQRTGCRQQTQVSQAQKFACKSSGSWQFVEVLSCRVHELPAKPLWDIF